MNAGEIGEQLAELVISEIDNQPNETARQIVYARVLRAMTGHELYVPPKPPERKVEAMNDAQAKAFESCTMPFGQFVGERIEVVPVGYLCRFSDPSPWVRDIKRYLASERGKQRIENET